MTRLSARQVSKVYGATPVLNRLDFDLDAGEIRALVGENGAGKSTFIKIVSGAVLPSDGTVTLDGAALPLGSPYEVRRRGVSVVYQELTLVPDMTVTDNVFLGRELGSGLLRHAQMRHAARAILDDLHADVDPAAPVRELNIAQQQMVEIARALLFDAKVLILDEPSATLSPGEVDGLFSVLRRLSGRGIGVIYVSHRLEEIAALAHSVTVLRDGRHVATEPVANCDRAKLIRLMVGRDLSEEFPARSGACGAPLLEVKRLSAPPRFSDVSLTLHHGEILGVAGLVGAGRTSMALALVGALRARGEMALKGRITRFGSPAAAIRGGMSYVTEDRKARGVFSLLGTDENIAMSQLSTFATAGWLFNHEWRRRAQSAADRVDLRATDLRQPAGTLSGGNQQKALLARYLLRPPAVLIVDEPTRGVDIGARSEIYRILNELTQTGVGILMISSDLQEVLGMSDRVVVMRDGRTTGELSRSHATAERVMALATCAA